MIAVKITEDGAVDHINALAKKYRDKPMAGRSNLQQAVPITFGYKMATMLAAFERHKQRLAGLPDALHGFTAQLLVANLGTVGEELEIHQRLGDTLLERGILWIGLPLIEGWL